MTITASCGHTVDSVDDLVSVNYDDQDIDFNGEEPCFVPVVVYSAYCPKCAAYGFAEGYLRKTTEPGFVIGSELRT